MEFFNKAKSVRLKSHLGKYLIADEDQESVLQDRNGSSRKARWAVELVAGNPHLIRLKSCHDRYLTASDEPFLLGMTGKKVLQTVPSSRRDTATEWEPIREGFQLRLRTRGGKFLRANGATPPWRNSVTHDLPHRTATQDWVLWEVDVLEIFLFDSPESSELVTSQSSSVSSTNDHDSPVSRTRHSFGSSVGSAPDHDSAVSSPRRSRRSSVPSTPEHGHDQDHSAISHAHSMPITTENLTTSTVLKKNRWLSMSSNNSLPASPRQGVSGMEFFDKAKAVRLQSHLGKYLVADDDEETVRQSRNGSSHRARWTVEFIEGKSNVIRLKSCHGLYLTATNEAHLLGMTGKKVLQTLPPNKMDPSIEWEPLKEGFHIKLRTNEGKYLRANGATPPWRNSITHDIPHRTATQDWVLWGVDIVDIAVSDTESAASVLSPASSCNSLPDDYCGSPDTGSPSVNSERSGNASVKLGSGMEFFKKAKSVRLKSHHDKFLVADSDQETVIQDRHGTSKNAKWTVEFVDDFSNVVRLKSCYGKYLTATDEQFLLGVTGRSVKQTMPRKLDSSIEWEPIRDGVVVRLKTRYGNYLRANGGLPPWRNSITHDIPHRHKDWILWQVDVLEIRPEPPKKIPKSDSFEEDLSSASVNLRTPGFSTHERHESVDASPKKAEGRMVYYRVVDEGGNVDDEIEEPSFEFKGHGLEELTQKLEEETGHENIIVCSRNPFNGQLYPLRLSLPPNNATMHIVVVPSTSKVADNFLPKNST